MQPRSVHLKSNFILLSSAEVVEDGRRKERRFDPVKSGRVDRVPLEDVAALKQVPQGRRILRQVRQEHPKLIYHAHERAQVCNILGDWEITNSSRFLRVWFDALCSDTKSGILGL